RSAYGGLVAAGLMWIVQPVKVPCPLGPQATVYAAAFATMLRVLSDMNTVFGYGNGCRCPVSSDSMSATWARYGSAPAESADRQAMFGSCAGAFGACSPRPAGSTGPAGVSLAAGSTRPAGVVWLVGASRSCSTAARWSAVSSPQWPNTQIPRSCRTGC